MGCWADWTQNRDSGPHLLHILAGVDILVVDVILAMVGLSVADGIGWEFVISLIGGFLSFERSNFLAFVFLPELA